MYSKINKETNKYYILIKDLKVKKNLIKFIIHFDSWNWNFDWNSDWKYDWNSDWNSYRNSKTLVLDKTTAAVDWKQMT